MVLCRKRRYEMAKMMGSEVGYTYAYFAKSQFSCSTYLVLFFLPLGLTSSTKSVRVDTLNILSMVD
jgi:hypothetical protein